MHTSFARKIVFALLSFSLLLPLAHPVGVTPAYGAQAPAFRSSLFDDLPTRVEGLEPSTGLALGASGKELSEVSVSSSSSCEHYVGERLAECEALVDLYNSTGGGGWTDNGGRDGGWLQGSYCFWNGITCRGNFYRGEPHAQVLTIDLRDNNLVGSLPDSMGDFPILQSLNLSGNSSLSGQLPQSMINLRYLDNFWYNDTKLCAPESADFQFWLGSIAILSKNDCSCTPKIESLGASPNKPMLEQSYL